MYKNKKSIVKTFSSLFICVILIITAVLLFLNNICVFAASSQDCVYLSDMEYEPQSLAGWVTNPDYPRGRILKDRTVNDTKISVKIEDAWYEFDKGLFTHAAANVYYNVQNCGYRYFTAYVGLDKTITKKSDGVKFFVYTTTDDTITNTTDWILKTASDPAVKGIGEEADFLSVDISGAKYLRLHVDPNVSSGADYAVWADAKLSNSAADEGDETVHSLAYYDNLIKQKNWNNLNGDPELELLVLQRELVRRAGQYALKKFKNDSEANREVLNWLVSDVDVLREFMLGGAPGYGNYYNSLTVLSDLYRNYKTDLNNTQLLENKWKPNRTYGEMYRTMMFSIALTHDITVGSWLQSNRVENQSDPVRRYAIYRYLYTTGRFIAKDREGNTVYETQDLFGSLTVEEMRWIMFNIIDDESIIWLNDYVQRRIYEDPTNPGKYHAPHVYIAYTNPNYGNPVFYSEEYKDYFNDLFAVCDRQNPDTKIGLWDVSYTIPGGVDNSTYTLKVTRGTEDDKIQKVWMNFRNQFNTGCVCGGISKSGTNIRGARGIPCTVIGQPGHAAMLCYGKNSEGKGYWGIDNDVSGWTLSTKNERHLLGWGNESWQRNTHPTIVYFNLAQDALNDYDNYVSAEEHVMLANSYAGNLDVQEKIYKKALTAQKINIDAWYGLINTYGNKTTAAKKDDLITLANSIADTMVGYPLPMYDLLNVIKPYLVSDNSGSTGSELTDADAEYLFKYTLIENGALISSRDLPASATDKTMFPGLANREARYLLGDVDNSVAKFSFDGEHAGCIVLASRFDGAGIRLQYSLDNKQNWTALYFTAEEAHVHQLTPAELASITEENDIYIRIEGDLNSVYKIDISSKPVIPSTLFVNDFENKIFGLDERFEWKYENAENWTPYSETSLPDCTGAKTVEVRLKAAGENPPSDAAIFTFTKDTDTDTRKYVSVSHLSIEGYSSQSNESKRPYFATNAIDGNSNTFWHTDFHENALQTGNTPYLIIKIDSPKYISGLEFTQKQYSNKINIFAKTVNVYVSEDGKNWTKVGSQEYPTALDDLKVVNFDEVMLGQYIKLEIEDSFETVAGFTTVSTVNVYEDTTKTVTPPVTPPDTSNDTDKPKDNTALIVALVIVGVIVVSAAVFVTVFIKKKRAKKSAVDSPRKINSNGKAEKNSKVKPASAAKSASAAKPAAATKPVPKGKTNSKGKK